MTSKGSVKVPIPSRLPPEFEARVLRDKVQRKKVFQTLLHKLVHYWEWKNSCGGFSAAPDKAAAPCCARSFKATLIALSEVGNVAGVQTPTKSVQVFANRKGTGDKRGGGHTFVFSWAEIKAAAAVYSSGWGGQKQQLVQKEETVPNFTILQ